MRLRFLHAVLLAAVVALPAGLAQADANARDDLVTQQDVTAVGLSAGGQRLGVAVVDAGSTSPLDGSKDQDTWFLYDVLATSLNQKQDGGVDPAECDGAAPTDLSEDCKTPARLVALSDDGKRMAAAGTEDEQGQRGSQVVFAEAQSGELDQEAIAGRVTHLATSGTGSRVVAASDHSGLSGSGGKIHVWAWGATTASASWDADTAAPVTGLDMSSDGQRVVALAGNEHLRFLSDGTLKKDTVSGDFTSVAIANDAKRTSIAGTASGAFRIYSDDAPGGEMGRELNVPGEGAVNAVAIDASGTVIAIGRENGFLSVWTLHKAPVLIDATVFHGELDGAVHDLRLSDDGSVLLVRMGSLLRMYSVTDTLDPLWNTTLPATVSGLAMDAAGERVAASHGKRVRILEAHHEIAFQVPHPGDLTPGQDHVVRLALENLGNRRETVQLTAEGGGLALELANATVSLLPGQEASVDLTIGVASTHPPQDVRIFVNATAGAVVSRTIEAAVPEHEAWELRRLGVATSLPVEAGGDATFTPVIANVGNVAGVPPVTVRSVGAGWSAQIIAGDGELGAGQTAQLAVRLRAPADAANLAQGKAIVEIPGQEPLELVATVGATFRVELGAPARVSVEPGNATSFTVQVSNTGNAPDSYELRLGAVPTGWVAELENGFSEMTLRDVADGARRDVQVRVQAPEGAAGAPVSVSVQVQSLADGDATAARTTLVDIQAADEPPADPPGNGSPLPLVWVAAALLVAMRRRG